MTRKELREMGVTDEAQITAILNKHRGELEDLKEAHELATPPAKPTAAPEAQKPSHQPAEQKPASKGNSEADQLRQELAAEKQKNAARERRDAIMGALAAYNPKNAAVLLAQIDMSRVVLKDGKVESGLDEQVHPLKESDGYLFTDTPAPRGGAEPKGASVPTTMNDIIRGGT